MKSDHERAVVNGEQLRALRDLFDSEIKRVDQILSEREKESAKSLAESLRARELADEWRAALIDREVHFTRVETHELLQKQVDAVVERQNEGRGRQTAWVAAAGIIATLLALGVGQILRSNLTAADVSQQIQNEAPWNADQPEIERRITQLERQQEALQLQVTKLQQQLLLTTRR